MVIDWEDFKVTCICVDQHKPGKSSTVRKGKQNKISMLQNLVSVFPAGVLFFSSVLSSMPNNTCSKLN